MNISTSECCSGCSESGWTMYLDQLSQYSTDSYSRSLVKNCQGNGLLVHMNADEGDEDLSMVSDASSGPPHLHDNNLGDTPYDKRKSKQKCTEAEVEYQPRGVKKQQDFCLDDTATSPILHFSQDNAAPRENNNSQGVSIANNQISFFSSSGKGKSGSLQGRKRP